MTNRQALKVRILATKLLPSLLLEWKTWSVVGQKYIYNDKFQVLEILSENSLWVRLDYTPGLPTLNPIERCSVPRTVPAS